MSKVNLNSSKSWKLTLAAIIIAIAMNVFAGPLNGLGFLVDENTLTNLVYMALGIGGIGAGLKGIKTTKTTTPTTPTVTPEVVSEEKIIQFPTIQTGSTIQEQVPVTATITTTETTKAATSTVDKTGIIVTVPAVQTKMEPPVLGPVGSKFKTNFTRDSQRGNVIFYGQSYLWVQIEGVRSYVTAILRDSKLNVIQIDQSHQNDEDGDISTTRFELFARDGTPLPRGKYHLEYRGDSGSSDSIGISNDQFEIV